jgi:hypothetical protein
MSPTPQSAPMPTLIVIGRGSSAGCTRPGVWRRRVRLAASRGPGLDYVTAVSHSRAQATACSGVMGAPSAQAASKAAAPSACRACAK